MTEAAALPQGWINEKLARLVEPRGEKASPADRPESWFVGMNHIESHTMKIIGRAPATSMKSSAAAFEAGDVLYGRLRPYLNKVARPSFDGLASAEFIVFPDTELVKSKFLQYRLNAGDFVSFASHLDEGDRPRVNFNQIGTFDLQLPPPTEQMRIVSKLEELFSELDKGVESLKTAQKQLKVYRQAVLKHAFEGKLTADWRAANRDKLETADQLLARIQIERDAHYQQQIKEWKIAVEAWESGGKDGKKPSKPSQPRSPLELKNRSATHQTTWTWLPLGHLASEMVLGKMLDKQKNTGDEKPYLGNINVRWGRFDLSNVKQMKFEQGETDRYGLKNGDLVVCEGGEPGRCAVWKGDDDTMFIQKALHRVRFTASYSAVFAYNFLTFAVGFGLADRYYTGTTIKHLTGKGLGELPFPVCSLDEQAEIVRVIEDALSAVESLETEVADGLKRVNALRQSILKKAFSGQLVPQDPNDEPASVLLERIRAERDGISPKRRRKAPAEA